MYLLTEFDVSFQYGTILGNQEGVGKNSNPHYVLDQESLTQKSSTRRLLRLQGEDVRQLQEALIKAGYQVDLDGIFGPATDKAVRQFQQDKNLTVDSVVGMQTLTALGLNSHQ